MQYSPYQLAFFDFVSNGSGNAFVRAVAGSGKTSTSVAAVSRLPARQPGDVIAQSIRFLAFNKAIADELQRRVPSHVTCSTFHSLGFAALKQVIGRDVKVEGRKVSKLVWNVVNDRDNPDTQNIIRLVSLAKNIGIGCLIDDTDENWHEIIRNYDLQLDEPNTAVRIARKCLSASNANRKEIDFDDMLYLAVLLNALFSPLDYVFVDEAQDTNFIQIEVLRRCAKPASEASPNPTRYFFVGDPAQAIYGFRGAGRDAIETIIREFACVTLPLSVCYRCGKSIIKRAQSIVPDIQHWDDAPDGEVRTLERYTAAEFVPGSSILCRNVAPLVSFAYSLLKRDIPCVIVGRDVGKQLIDLIKKMRAVTLDDLSDKLRTWQNCEVVTCEKEGTSPDRIYDQFECMQCFINALDEDSRSVASLIAKIELMFTETTDASRVSLSSIHKSKGLEWGKVFLLDRSLCPSRFAKLPWQLVQERNLLYVATTRARLSLNYINSGCWEETKQ